ncbi:hypothetical protein [Adhaeribacter aquaticus]|uniref:hypothetical protein n=1 Tax=Adhaeribacter aquaticus TaxID=299567 RepID=UPI00041458B3|nr:hypothetical protein [Adhaeribacter aquaticus]
MIQELKNTFDRVYLTIEVDDKNKWVHVNWMGYLTEENIKTGGTAYIDALKKADYQCVLNDTRMIVGGWNHSLDWVVNEWAPYAASSGLEYFAMISNPESFGGSSASKFYEDLKAFQAQVFNEKRTAEEWLRQFSLRK